jgi:hypothetical protein
MAILHQAAGDIGAHTAQSDNCDLHEYSWWRLTGALWGGKNRPEQWLQTTALERH